MKYLIAGAEDSVSKYGYRGEENFQAETVPI